VTTDDRDPATVDVPSGDADESGGSRSSSISGRDRRTPDDRPPKGGKSRLNVWQETLLLIVMAVVVAVVVKQFFLQAFYIPSESMEPGLVLNDRILVEKPSYWFDGEPRRGDVVVFQDPGGWLSEAEDAEPGSLLTRGLADIGLYPTGGHLVKRVIGVGGDTIVCCDEQGRIEVNGTPLDEPYARPGQRSGGARAGGACFGPMTQDCSWKAGPVPEGFLFVMGDNRANSADSSAHMCGNATDCGESPYVPVDNVVGKVAALAWPLDRAHWVKRPDTYDTVPER